MLTINLYLKGGMEHLHIDILYIEIHHKIDLVYIVFSTLLV